MRRLILYLSAFLIIITTAISFAYADPTEDIPLDTTYIEHIHRSEMTEEFQCQVTFITDASSNLTDSTYIIFKDDTGTLYRASMIPDNLYETRMYLEPGHYTIIATGAYNTEAEFIPDVTEFTLENENSIKTVVLEIRSPEETTTPDNTGETTIDKTGPENTLDPYQHIYYPTTYENIIMDETGTLYYEVSHNGEGPGTMTTSGFARGNYNVVVKIIKSGVIGEAEMAISIDGGTSYIATAVLNEAYLASNLGLTFKFATENDTDEFVVGDTFEASVIECFPATTSQSLKDVMLMCVGHPMNSYELTVRILSSGGLGVSKVSITDERGKISVTETIPENGILEIKDNLTLVFSDLEGYTKGVVFTVSVTSNDATIDYTPAYYLAAGVGALLLIGFIVLLLKKDKPATYHIHKYKWQQTEDHYE